MVSYEKCCDKKTVGQYSYSLASVGGNVPAGCLNSCVYTQDNDPDKMFCFGRGTETVTCQGNIYKVSPLIFVIKLIKCNSNKILFRFKFKFS